MIYIPLHYQISSKEHVKEQSSALSSCKVKFAVKSPMNSKLRDPVLISDVEHTLAAWLWKVSERLGSFQALRWLACRKVPTEFCCSALQQSPGLCGRLAQMSVVLKSPWPQLRGAQPLPSGAGTPSQIKGWLAPSSPKESWDHWFPGQSGQALLVSFTSNSNRFFPTFF